MVIEEIKLIKRSDLRVYINPAGPDVAGEPGVFYSRRSQGPYYRWSFEVKSVRWCGSRVYPSALTLRTFCVESWKAVPPALQARLDEHYPE